MNAATDIEVVNVEAEQSVIGALLIKPDAFDRMSTPLRPAHFGRDDHRRIFAAITDLLATGKSVDLVSVADALESRGESERTGGLAYLADIANATPSAANIRHYAEIVVERAQLRALLAAAGDISDMARAAGMPIREKLDRAQQLMQSIVDGAAVSQPTPQPLAEVMKRHVSRIDARHNGEAQAVATGFKVLDRTLNGGLRPGQFVLIAARPSMGKTSLALQVADNVARDGRVALFCSQEMPEGDILDRLIAIKHRINLGDLVAGRLDDDGWSRISEAMRDSQQSRLHIDEQPALTLTDVATKARYVRRIAGRIDLVVVDYIQLMSGSGDNRNAELERISRGLKQLAKELAIPVIALAQLSRACESRTNRRPLMSDLRDSGALEQDADVVAFVYRDEQYNTDSPDKGTAEILIRKNRQGSTGDVRLAWISYCARFDDLDIDAYQRQRRDHDERPQARRRGFSDIPT